MQNPEGASGEAERRNDLSSSPNEPKAATASRRSSILSRGMALVAGVPAIVVSTVALASLIEGAGFVEFVVGSAGERLLVAYRVVHQVIQISATWLDVIVCVLALLLACRLTVSVLGDPSSLLSMPKTIAAFARGLKDGMLPEVGIDDIAGGVVFGFYAVGLTVIFSVLPPMELIDLVVSWLPSWLHLPIQLGLLYMGGLEVAKMVYVTGASQQVPIQNNWDRLLRASLLSIVFLPFFVVGLIPYWAFSVIFSGGIAAIALVALNCLLLVAANSFPIF